MVSGVTDSREQDADAGATEAATATLPRRAVKATVMVLGARPEPVVDEPGDIASVTGVPDDDDDGALLDLVGEAVQDGRLIAICPTWYDDRARRRLETARALVGAGRVAVHTTNLPPLAVGVLATLADAIGSRMPSPGATVAALGALEARLVGVTWLAGVGGLREPSPSLLQHAASVWPRSTFAVCSHPEPVVHRLKRKAVPPGIDLPSLGRRHQLVVAPADGDPAWLIGPARAGLGDPLLLEAEATPHGAEWWGTRRLVEGVVHPTDLDALVHELREALTLGSCRWCEELLGATPCPFCGLADPA